MSTEKQAFSEANREIISAAVAKQDLKLSDLKSPGFDAESLWERVDRDLELLRELIAVFEEESPVMLARVAAAVEQGNAEELAKSAHKLKGSVLQFSGRVAAASAQKLEEMGKSGKVDGAAPLVAELRLAIDQLMKSVRAMTARLAGGKLNVEAGKGAS